MNHKYKKITKKAGVENYGHPTAIVGSKKVGVMGIMFMAIFAAVWAVMPAI